MCVCLVEVEDACTDSGPILALPWIRVGHFAQLVRDRVFVFFSRRGNILSSFPVADLLRTLDAMSWVKINTFHWHITDSQSFPLEVAKYPQLAANGAYSADEMYSESDIQYIVQYAAAVRFPPFLRDPLLTLRVVGSVGSTSSWYA